MAAQTGYAATVSINSGGGYSPVTNVISIKTPPLTLGKTEVKALGITLREITYLPTLIEQGEIEVECIYTNTEYTRLLPLVLASGHIKIIFANGDYVICDGWVSHVGESTMDAENVQKFTWKWQVGSSVAFTAGNP